MSLTVIENAVHWVLDADANSMWHNGTRVQLWPFNNQGNQKWILEARFPWFKIRCPVSNRVLDADSNTINQNGTIVQLWDDLDGFNQLWYFLPVDNGKVMIFNASSGRVLDADLNAINVAGCGVQLWDNYGSGNQKWYLRPVTL